MKKKQKDYPDECPVFRLDGDGDYHWNGTHGQVTLVRTEGFDFPVVVDAICNPWLPAKLHELHPLTPAAEDLLAAIKAELGL